jgi:hypothetical protein
MKKIQETVDVESRVWYISKVASKKTEAARGRNSQLDAKCMCNINYVTNEVNEASSIVL